MKEFLEFKLLEWGNYLLTVGDLVIVFLIFGGTKILSWLIRKAYNKRFSGTRDNRGRKFALIRLTGYIIWTFSLLMMLQAAGVKITLLLAGSAALLVGIGLGLQQTFTDFLSGFILLIDHTIEVDDVIEIDGMVARVENIGIRTSTLVTRDDISVIVPNSKITGSNVINWSHTKEHSRFHIPIGVAYGSDEELVRKVLLDCASDHPGILKQPPPFVRLEEFADSSVNFKLYFWTSEVFRVENTKSDLRFSVVKKLKENNITIPFPQMDVYVKQVP
ncbi:MAG TPA: mechanosensitive ion channel [Chitinophagaceae bacterium]|nr:mechanosensitive ion channel [Chitinophagaceae bacterium]MCB9055504.1 mechanosensitive ion channel [Chitinophagales bacterium]HPG10688.1 mechanosensitive ion channel [Chitinophagaceae bacterium]HRX92709.1 mechanosensitive ion channel [Chitinophagaceae bacterium]